MKYNAYIYIEQKERLRLTPSGRKAEEEKYKIVPVTVAGSPFAMHWQVHTLCSYSDVFGLHYSDNSTTNVIQIPHKIGNVWK